MKFIFLQAQIAANPVAATQGHFGMQIITEQDVCSLLSIKHCIQVVRTCFARLHISPAANQPRRRLHAPGGTVLHQLAGLYEPYIGVKVYSTHPKHGAHFFVLLFDSATGKPLAMIDANHLGQIRTGAASGVATDLLARPDAHVLGVIGAGFQARTQVEAIRAVRDIREVRVWSRGEANRQRFAEETNSRATATAEEAVRGADIIVTATYAKDPVLESSWVEPGTHINAIGSNNPTRRELPADLIARAALIAVDALDQARIESGDLILAWTEQDWCSPRLVEMSRVAAGLAGRTSADEITIFKSNGLGIQDIAAAGYVWERFTS
jgi:ornithine cyclodeaminase/alanine dehydrogenase-like protein (mu-crystallin family)